MTVTAIATSPGVTGSTAGSGAGAGTGAAAGLEGGAPSLFIANVAPVAPRTKLTMAHAAKMIHVSIGIPDFLLPPLLGAAVSVAVGAGINTTVGAGICAAEGARFGTGVGKAVGMAVGSGVGVCDGSGDGAGVGENVSIETDSTDAHDIEKRRRPFFSSSAGSVSSRRWLSAVAKSTILAVSVPSTTDEFSTSVTCCRAPETRAHRVRQAVFASESCERWSELVLLHHTAVIRSARSNALTSCTELPYLAAITSGTVTSFDTTTELDVTSAHVASEKVAFLTIESKARSNTVPLNSSHVMPAIPSVTATIGVRVGFGVGPRVGCADVGMGVEGDIGAADGGRDVGAVDDTVGDLDSTRNGGGEGDGGDDGGSSVGELSHPPVSTQLTSRSRRSWPIAHTATHVSLVTL